MTTTEDGDGRVTSKRDDDHGCEFVHGARPAAGILHQAENEFREGQTSDVEAGGRAPKIDLSALSPPRSRGERSRDSILRVLDGFAFRILNLVVLFLVVVDGAFFFSLLIGAHGVCTPRTDCDPMNWWYNLSIQLLVVLFTYMAVITMPWRYAHALHLFGLCRPRRSNDDGKNIYGLDDDDVWFHIPLFTKRCIIVLLLLNCIAQYLNQVTRIVYYSYELSQATVAGRAWTLST